NVYWSGTTTGTTTDVNGKFSIEKTNTNFPKLIISYIGYENDTITAFQKTENLEIILSSAIDLSTVEISDQQKGNYVSRIDPIYTTNITGAELNKAACCNLSESFETNASVDVSYSDAVTGAKQIQLLGLAGIYSQMMTENMQNLYGLASTYGLGYIPGPWMESIQVSKGAASVINGYESITGQINVEFKKPDDSEKLFLNAYANHIGKLEVNLNSATKLNNKWSTMIFAHTENLSNNIDHNHDSFLDIPKVKQINIFNRWKYESDKFITQFGFKVLDEDRKGGQINFKYINPLDFTNGYGINIKTKRYEGFLKGGHIFQKKAGTSIGILNQATYHEQDSYFGLNKYNGIQKSYYSNIIFQSIFGNTNHKYNAGASFKYDDYNESFNDSTFSRIDIVPGIFFQYTYSQLNLLTVILGVRADNHNLYGTFYTPRFHVKYTINEHHIIRASAGKGYRTANIFAENSFLLASSRKLISLEKFKQEEGWNYGINFTKYIDIGSRQMTLNAEFYRTDFINQIVVDMDQEISRIYFYNLDGKSYSNSIQLELNYEPIKRFDVLVAFRYTDVKSTINGELLRKPLVNRYKGLINLSYATNLKKWQFDFTTQLNGDSRIPDTRNNPVEYQRPEKSPAYVIINAQVTKFYKKWSIYLGAENLTDFIQTDPIIAADNPYSEYFDSSMTWGPIMGRKIYMGLRFAIESN
ncbi:TonB-dependent receptor plug domain-containing protein, partial [Bacteroidota bacterium]